MVSGMYLGLYLLFGLFTKLGGIYTFGFLWWNLMSILSVTGLVHSTGTVRWPPGCIFTEWPSTKGTPDVESGNYVMVFPFECISFHVPSLVQITPMKFVAVKSYVLSCAYKLNDWVKGVVSESLVDVNCFGNFCIWFPQETAKSNNFIYCCLINFNLFRVEFIKWFCVLTCCWLLIWW